MSLLKVQSFFFSKCPEQADKTKQKIQLISYHSCTQ